MDWRALMNSDPRVAIRVLFGRPGESKLGSDGKRFVDGEVAWPGPVYFRKSKLRRHRVAVFSQLLAIVDCNAPLVHGLQMAAIDAPSAPLESVFLSLRDDLAAGLALWESMANLSGFFPKYCSELVKHGEETGALGPALRDLQELDVLALRDWETNRGLIFRYLGLLVLVCLGMALFTSIYVLPEFASVIDEFGGELPDTAQWIVETRARLTPLAYGGLVRIDPRHFLLGLAAVLVTVGLTGLALTRSGAFRVFTGSVAMAIPGLRTIYRRGNVAHIALVLERLLAVQTPLDVAIETTADLDIHPAFKRKMRRVCERVRQGTSLTDALQHEKGWPPSFEGLVAIGERSGLLSETFGKVGRFYNRDCARRTTMIRDSLVPISVVAVACVTLLAEVAVLASVVRVAEVMMGAM
ncbi:MAG: hypothetical protein GY851_35200 [bacterium]|nr:hypothetical protein [bacterium]